MRIRRIKKAMKIIKERETIKKHEDSEIAETTAMDLVVTMPTSTHVDNTAERAENENVEKETHVLIDISDILACDDNNEESANETTEATTENVKRNETNNDETEEESSIQGESDQKANECLNCQETFPDQESLCEHAINCSVQLQKYVMHMEKRRKEAKRYARRKTELSQKVEFTCGSCTEKFTKRNKLQQHISVRKKHNYCYLFSMI